MTPAAVLGNTVGWFVGHTVGDYLLQDDWQAANKRTNSLACFTHVAFYVTAVWAFTHWPWWALAVTFACHFLQDRFGLALRFMHACGKEKFARPPLAPWSIIVVDNTLHLVQLFLTAACVLGRAG